MKREMKETWNNWKWLIIGCAALISLALGILGYGEAIKVNHYPASYASTVYWSLQLFVFELGYNPDQSNWMFETSRFASPLIFMYTLWQAVSEVLKQNIERLKILFVNKHVVICGLGEKGLLLVEDFRKLKYDIVVIDSDEKNANIEQCREMGALVLLGNATNVEILQRARVSKAQFVFAVCGSDGINNQVAVYIDELRKDHQDEALTCWVHIADPELYDLLQEQEIMFGKNRFALEYFNIYRDGAKLLVRQHPYNEKGIAVPRVMIVGLGPLGESLLLQVAKSWYWEKGIETEKIHFILIDEQASRRIEILKRKYPNLSDACDIETPDIDTNSLFFLETNFYNIDIAYICIEDDAKCLSTGLSLVHTMGRRRSPVVVCVRHENGLGTLLASVNDGVNSLQALYPFGLFNNVFKSDLIKDASHELLAQAIHQEYVEQQKRAGVTGNSSMVAWNELDDILKNSNRAQADDYNKKLQRLNFGIRELHRWNKPGINMEEDIVEGLARQEHIRWWKQLRKEGWKYAEGPKNKDKKTHPCIVPWGRLSEEEKEKDRSAVRNVPMILARFGYEVYRVD